MPGKGKHSLAEPGSPSTEKRKGLGEKGKNQSCKKGKNYLRNGGTGRRERGRNSYKSKNQGKVEEDIAGERQGGRNSKNWD